MDDADLTAAIATLHPESKKQVGAWGEYGKFLLGLLVLGGAAAFVWDKVRGGKDDEEEEATGDAG
jgi:hypothetical protein